MRGWRLVGILCLVALILGGVGLIGMEGWVSYQCRAAEKAQSRQDYKQARAHYLKALTFHPWSADLHLKVARLSRQVGETNDDYQMAEQHLERCRQLQGGVTEEYQLERLMLKAETGEAAECFDDLIAYSDRPEAPLVLEALCKGFMRVQQTATAHQLAQKWVEKDPDNAHARVIRGLCISSLGNPTEAIPDFRYGLQRFPGNVEWRMHLAFVLSEAHRYKDAAAQFERVLPHLSNSKYARLGLARCLGALNEPARAKELLDGLVAEDPKFTDALVERGHLALQTDRPEEAEKDLSQALTNNPCDREALFLREQGLRRLGRSSEASQMAARMHRVEETGMRIQQLIQRSTPASMRDPAYCTERGKLVLENGKEAEGLFWLFRALKVQRNYPPALKALVEHYTKKGDKGEADKYRRLLGESG